MPWSKSELNKFYEEIRKKIKLWLDRPDQSQHIAIVFEVQFLRNVCAGRELDQQVQVMEVPQSCDVVPIA
jgi:hypothetical protein